MYGLKGQVNDEDGWGSKLDVPDKQTIKDAANEGILWIEDNQASASTEDLEEKLAGECLALDGSLLMHVQQSCRVLSIR